MAIMVEEGAGQTPETPENERAVPQEQTFGIEIVDDPVEGSSEPDDKHLALEAKIEELTAKLEAKAEPAPAQPSGETAMMAQILAEMQKQNAPKEEAAPSVNLEELAKKIDGNFFNNPSKSVYELITPVIQQLQEQQGAVISKQASQIERLTAQSDPASKDVLEKYSAEVDALTKGDSKVSYTEAIGKVRLAHLDEIVADKAAALLEAKMAELQTSAQPAPFTNASLPPSTARPEPEEPGTIRVTKSEAAKLRQFALSKALDFDDEDQQEYIYDKAKAMGVI